MEVYLDGKQIRADVDAFANGLNVAVQAAEASGRLVVGVIADGNAVAHAWLDAPDDVVAAVTKLECESVAARELVASAFTDAAKVLGETRASQLAAAEHLQLGEPEQAFVQLRPVLEGWGAVQQTVQSAAQLLRVDVESMGAEGGVALGALISDLGAKISGLQTAISAQDWSSAADTLAYDLDGACERWGDALTRLSGSMARRAA